MNIAGRAVYWPTPTRSPGALFQLSSPLFASFYRHRIALRPSPLSPDFAPQGTPCPPPRPASQPHVLTLRWHSTVFIISPCVKVSFDSYPFVSFFFRLSWSLKVLFISQKCSPCITLIDTSAPRLRWHSYLTDSTLLRILLTDSLLVLANVLKVLRYRS